MATSSVSLVTELQERVKRPGVGCSECGGRGGAKEVKLTSPPPPPIIVLLVVPTWTLDSSGSGSDNVELDAGYNRASTEPLKLYNHG